MEDLKVNEEILKAHMNHCVKEAFNNGNGEEKYVYDTLESAKENFEKMLYNPF